MREWLGKLIYGFAEVWKSIGISQRLSIISILLVAMGVIGGILYVGSRPDFVVLYSKMNTEAAAKVIEIVDSEGIEYKSRDDGRTIMVPRQHLSRLKAQVRATGVEISDTPKGWGLFDESELGMSQQQLRIKRQRAKQGELEKMLMNSFASNASEPSRVSLRRCS